MITKSHALKFKYFAYLVVRDALGFYFGIPKYLNSVDTNKLIQDEFSKILKKDPNLTSEIAEKQFLLAKKRVNKKLDDLELDYKYCEEILFTSNLWLDWLGIDSEFFQAYLNKLPNSIKDELTVVPNSKIVHENLWRRYLYTDHVTQELKFK